MKPDEIDILIEKRAKELDSQVSKEKKTNKRKTAKKHNKRTNKPYTGNQNK